MSSEAKLLTVQFLRWLAERPRALAELREAWQSTCPLNCAWEDAIADGLVAYQADGRVALTRAGEAAIGMAQAANAAPEAAPAPRRAVALAS